MSTVWVYSLGASTDPDHIECVVPWLIDDSLIFFGPCKKRIREKLWKDYLKKGVLAHASVPDPIHIVGVNGGNGRGVRKVVWWGKVAEVMTFQEAYSRLQEEHFDKMRSHCESPLHVEPVVEGTKLVGYKHISKEHAEDNNWIDDLVSKREKVEHCGDMIRLRQGETFDRDCCLLLENLFFAEGEGIEIDDDAVEIFRECQPEASKIDHYAIFGMTRGSERQPAQAIGLRGHYRTLMGPTADSLLAWLQAKSSAPKKPVRPGTDGTTKKRCS
jgi:hypothetical protein